MKRATVCGICIICTRPAINVPMKAPTATATQMVQTDMISLKSRVTPMPTKTASDDRRLPAAAVRTRLIIERPVSTTTVSMLLIMI